MKYNPIRFFYAYLKYKKLYIKWRHNAFYQQFWFVKNMCLEHPKLLTLLPFAWFATDEGEKFWEDVNKEWKKIKTEEI